MTGVLNVIRHNVVFSYVYQRIHDILHPALYTETSGHGVDGAIWTLRWLKFGQICDVCALKIVYFSVTMKI